MDTVGSAIDKLMTVNLKLFYNLGSTDMWKIKNLATQRRGLEEEVNELFVVAQKEMDENKIVRPQHKTY